MRNFVYICYRHITKCFSIYITIKTNYSFYQTLSIMAKRYISYKQYLNKSEDDRQECLKFWSDERIQNLAVNIIGVAEDILRTRTEIAKENIVSIIDFSGAYMYIGFCNQQTTGPAYLNAFKELLTELDIPFEASKNAQSAVFVEFDEFLLKFKA